MASHHERPKSNWLRALSLSFVFSHFINTLFALAATTPSASMTIPPLQWINLSKLTTGTPPPPLSGASIGYDETTRSLLIFGGETTPNSPTQATYILDLDNLTWSQPPPSVALPQLTNIPSRRSMALGGADIVANARQAFIMFGGQGPDGQPLDDIWSYDYQQNFWIQTKPSSDSNPSARWSVAGGTDTSLSVRNPTPSNFLNILYAFGGTSGNSTEPLTDVWELTIDGTLSANVATNPGSVTANWKKVPFPSGLPSKVGESSVVLPGGTLAIFGGCNSTSTNSFNSSCAGRDAYVVNPSTQSVLSPSFCPAPRFYASLTQNYNGGSSSFATQVFLLFGSFDQTQWDDNNGSQKGEVAILDTSSLLWSRVLPSGDPGSGGTPTFPSSRQGAAVLSWPSALVGHNRGAASDTITFGGRDPDTGNFNSDLWILRAYNGSISGSGQKWSGFGDGELDSGVDATGKGVTVQYLTQCATPINQVNPSPSSSTSPSSSSPNPAPPNSGNSQDVTTLHLVLAPLGLAVLLLSVTSARFYTPGDSQMGKGRAILMTSVSLVVGSFACGIAGIVTTFKPRSSGLSKRSITGRLSLGNHHGLAGLVLFICLYGSLALGASATLLWLRASRDRQDSYSEKTEKQHSLSGTQSPRSSSMVPSQGDRASAIYLRGGTQSVGESSRMASPWPLLGGGSGGRSESVERLSTESEPPTSRGFEVVNRTKHLRTQSAHLTPDGSRAIPRSLSDLSWLDRRRSLNAIGELDYALSQPMRGHTASQPIEVQDPLPTPIEKAQASRYTHSDPWLILQLFRIAFHLCLLGNLAFALAALFHLQNDTGFGVFLAWCIVAYAIIIWALVYRPRSSFLPLLQDQFLNPSPRAPESESLAEVQRAISPASNVHYQSPSTNFASIEYPPSTNYSHPQPRPVEPDPDEDDEDEDEKQLRMEQELQRRDVSIVTVPRRQLRITNL